MTIKPILKIKEGDNKDSYIVYEIEIGNKKACAHQRYGYKLIRDTQGDYQQQPTGVRTSSFTVELFENDELKVTVPPLGLSTAKHIMLDWVGVENQYTDLPTSEEPLEES
jgi:hypothetical protein